MSNSFNNRVFGCAVIKAINASYNADFSHQPRTLPNGKVYATDKALKYTIRNYWVKNFPFIRTDEKETGEKVLYFKNFDNDLKPRSLDETYKTYFGEYPKKLGKTKKDDSKPDEFFLFGFDGVNVTSFLTDKPKADKLKALFNSEDYKDLKETTKSFGKAAGKESIAKSLDDAKKEISDENEEISDEKEDKFFFYFDKGGLQKIEGEDYEQLKKIAEEVDNLVSGGLDRIAILSNLLSCLDIRLFGATYAGEINLSIHGPVQITHGINQYKEGIIYTEQISSPFRNSNEKSADSMQTTLGTQSKLEEGHYVHHFSVNPSNLRELATRAKSDGVTADDIAKLKEALRCGATFYDSASKAGVENELLLWVQLKEGSKLVLPSFVELVSVNENREVDLAKVASLLSKPHIAAEIETIELYFNKEVTTVINAPQNAKQLELN